MWAIRPKWILPAMNENSRIYVECYSGYTYAQEPRSFVVDEKRKTITDVRRRWREPRGPCFEVLADDGNVYLLKYDETADVWHVSVTM